MNKTEEKTKRWLESQGYVDLIYQHRHSPDFLVNGGKGFESKLLRNNAVTFSKTQIENLNKHNDVTVLLFNDGAEVPIKQIPYEELVIPGYWGLYRLVMVDFHKYRPLSNTGKKMKSGPSSHIRITKTTKAELDKIAGERDTYDDVIQDLLENGQKSPS